MATTQEGFTAKDVMTLRQKTGLGMMDCKKALTESGGDMDAAEQWLRDHLRDKMQQRTERATGEGRIGIAVSGDQAVIIEVRTETDFTARNDDFVAGVDRAAQAALQLPAGPVEPDDAMSTCIDELRITTRENVNFARGEKLQGGSFGSYVHHDGKRGCLLQTDGVTDPDLLKGLCQHIVALDPAGISAEDIPAEKLETIRAEALAEARESGKPAEIAQKIAQGKARKFLQENTLLHQKYVLDESRTIEKLLPAGASITKFIRYTLGAE